MYCVNCGVKLADGQQVCPLCNTEMVFPEHFVPGERGYPKQTYPEKRPRTFGAQIVLSAMFLLPMLIVILCDLQMSAMVGWSGYVVGALLVVYVWAILPIWFRKPNPVIFTPCGFAALGIYLLYIDLVTGGGWFLNFAFPVVGALMLVITAAVTLLRYVKGGTLYILGGTAIALGGIALMVELLMIPAFGVAGFRGWSLYPLIVLTILGGMLIFLGICRPVRQIVERKTFL